MLDKIKNMFGTDPFIPTSNIFPRIDTNRLKKKLDLEKKGKNRGVKELPPSDITSLDSVENEIIDSVRSLRDICYREYNDHKEVYNERQTRVTTASTELESSATKAPSKFKGISQGLETHLQESTVRLTECADWKKKFRIKHQIDRACHHYNSNRIIWLALAMIMVFVESILNGYLFAQKNQFGLLGGGFAALLISVTNVGFSSLIGFYSRFINHVNVMLKIFSLVLLLGWAVIVIVFNFGVAHFRDGMVENLSWNDAAIKAVERIYQTPFELSSIESWILVLIGCLISVIAMLKGYYADDPYPGYGNVERELDKARNNFESIYESAIHELMNTKDQMVEDLKEAEETLRNDTNNLIDGLFGNTSLNAQFEVQLKHCDDVAHTLLKLYRDSNSENRTTPPPKHFTVEFKFEKIDIPKTNEISLEKLKQGLDHIEELIKKSVEEINYMLEVSIENFPSARTIEKEISDQTNNRTLSSGKTNNRKKVWKSQEGD